MSPGKGLVSEGLQQNPWVEAGRANGRARESPQGSSAGGPAVRLPIAGSSQQGREEQPRARCGLADLTALGDAVPSLPLLPYLTTKPYFLPFKTRPIKCQARRGVKVADIRLCGDK